jgi:drug/metabolite transporter (DMT)-like permease
VLNRVASILLILAGLYLALIADVDETSDMRTFGWVIVAAGAFGVIASIVFPRLGQRRDRP